MITYKYNTGEHLFSETQGYMGFYVNGRKLSHELDCQGVIIKPWVKDNNEIENMFKKIGFEKIVD